MAFQPLLAVKRFGLGSRPGELAALRSDPRGSVIAQLGNAAASVTSAHPPSSTLPGTTREAFVVARRYQIENSITASAKLAANEPPKPTEAAVAAPATANAAQVTKAVAQVPVATPQRPPDPANQMFQAEVEARFKRAVATSAPFVERLVWFWSNHFCVAANKDQMIRATAGAYEREVIRPNVLGRFRDMLGGVVHSIAMQNFLDNRVSVGPNSLVGRWHKRGLNENLARELMELHTLGVDGGYSQTDVTQLARILTGWTIADMDAVDPGATVFIAEAHDPGPIEVLGKSYAEPGRGQLDQALDDLARHPSTATFIAGKLAGHFVGVDASPALVDTLAETFRRTDGHLGEVAKALVSSDHAWAAGTPRTIPPWDYAVAVGRALEIDLPISMVNRVVDLLGQRTWEVSSPKGWADDEDWSGTAALLERLDWADDIGRRFAGQRDVPALAQSLFEDGLSRDTATAVHRAESRQQALALMLMSPEFQRR